MGLVENLEKENLERGKFIKEKYRRERNRNRKSRKGKYRKGKRRILSKMSVEKCQLSLNIVCITRHIGEIFYLKCCILILRI
jgi:hypothetical protein